MTYPPQPPTPQQTPGQPQPQYGQYPQQPMGAPQSSSLAMTGFILALVAIPLSFVPFLNFLAFLMVPAALIISIIANNQVKASAGRLTGKGFAVAGIWISAVWMALGLIMIVFAGIFAASVLGGLSGIEQAIPKP